MLELVDVHTGYGRTEVIHGVSLEVPVRRGRRGDGPQRRGQDDAAARGGRAAEMHVRARCCSTATTSPSCGPAPGWRAAWRTCRRASSRSGS